MCVRIVQKCCIRARIRDLKKEVTRAGKVKSSRVAANMKHEARTSMRRIFHVQRDISSRTNVRACIPKFS